jgi:hypothetical protein
MLFDKKLKTENSNEVTNLDKIRFYWQKINIQRNLLSTTTVSPKTMGGRGSYYLKNKRKKERNSF